MRTTRTSISRRNTRETISLGYVGQVILISIGITCIAALLMDLLIH